MNVTLRIKTVHGDRLTYIAEICAADGTNLYRSSVQSSMASAAILAARAMLKNPDWSESPATVCGRCGLKMEGLVVCKCGESVNTRAISWR